MSVINFVRSTPRPLPLLLGTKQCGRLSWWFPGLHSLSKLTQWVGGAGEGGVPNYGGNLEEEEKKCT